MKELFTDIYKKLAGFFHSTEEKEDASKNVACNRLKFVLMQDRTNLNPYLLERMRSEIVDVLSKYVEMDREALELSFEQEGESTALMLSIPVIRAKEEEEIQAIIDEEEKAKKEKEAKEAEDETSEESEEAAAEELEEAEKAFEEESTETVDAESESDDEEVCTCVDEADCEEGCGCEESDCSGEGCGCGEGECACEDGEHCGCEEHSEESSSDKKLSRKAKKNKN